MRQDLLRRLEKLEGRLLEVQVPRIVWVARIEKERRGMLATSERIVEDWYLQSDDSLSSVKERVTADPTDVGLNYKNDGSGLEVEDSSFERRRIAVGHSRFYGSHRRSSVPDEGLRT